jgi:hypothetical protein
MGKIGWWPNVKKGLAMLGAAGVLATGGVVVQQTALPDVASAYSTWWASTSTCYNGYIRKTWYEVRDYTWYEEMMGKVDYNYPTLYYPSHYQYTSTRCWYA